MNTENDIPICRCGQPVKFSNQSQCEDCWNEPLVIGRKPDGSPRVTGVLPSPRTHEASAFPWVDQFLHRPFGQRIKFSEMLTDR